MSKHTPTPWAVIVDGYVDDLDGIAIADCAICTNKRSYEEHKANAAHIVKCVNLHNELVEALERALSTVRTHAMQTYSKSSAKEAVQLEDLLRRARGEK